MALKNKEHTRVRANFMLAFAAVYGRLPTVDRTVLKAFHDKKGGQMGPLNMEIRVPGWLINPKDEFRVARNSFKLPWEAHDKWMIEERERALQDSRDAEERAATLAGMSGR